MPGRLTSLIYGTLCYLIFLGTFLYAIGFVGNVFVPKSIDSGRTGPLAVALAIDAALLGLFALQHSVMARPAFKRAWTRIVPEPVERSTYVLFTSLCLLLMFWQWRPIGGTVWQIEDPVFQALVLGVYAGGWVLVLVATFLINHFDLFGLRQVWVHFRGQKYQPLGFQTPGLYKHIRHPLYVGWFCVFWATPTMTAAHLVFAVATTLYILIAIRFEERDLVTVHGEAYAKYRQETPMFIPSVRNTEGTALSESAR